MVQINLPAVPSPWPKGVTVNIDEICTAVKDIFEDTLALAEPASALAVAGVYSLNNLFLEMLPLIQ